MEEETNQTPTWKDESSSPATAPPQAHRKISRTGSIPVVQQASEQSGVELGDLMESTELAELSNQVPVEKLASPKDLRRRTSSCDEEDSWDKLYNETGDLLRPEALEEVNHPSLLNSTLINGEFFFYLLKFFLIVDSRCG